MGLVFSRGKNTPPLSLSDSLTDDSIVQIPIGDLGEPAELQVISPVEGFVADEAGVGIDKVIAQVEVVIDGVDKVIDGVEVVVDEVDKVVAQVEPIVRLVVELPELPELALNQVSELHVNPSVEQVDQSVNPSVELVDQPANTPVDPPANPPDNPPVRIFDCPLCKPNSKIPSHSLRKCRKFFEYKKNLSKIPYIIKSSTKLNPSEERGFCAGGIVPYTINPEDNSIKILGLVESRDGLAKFNFIGGGREGIKHGSNRSRPELSWETAYAEFGEELGELLTEESFNAINQLVSQPNNLSAFWSPKSKMALYSIYIGTHPIKLKLKEDLDISKCEAQSFQWIDLNGWDGNPNIHDFCKQILADIELTGMSDFFAKG